MKNINLEYPRHTGRLGTRAALASGSLVSAVPPSMTRILFGGKL